MIVWKIVGFFLLVWLGYEAMITLENIDIEKAKEKGE